MDFQDEHRSIECDCYYIHINDGADVELEVIKDDDFEEEFYATLKFTYNGKEIDFDEDIQQNLEEDLVISDGDKWISKSSYRMIIPKTFSDYYEESIEGENAELINEFCEYCRKAFARQLTRDAGIYATYDDENMEQQVEEQIINDRMDLYNFKCAVDDDAVEKWLINEDYIIIVEL